MAATNFPGGLTAVHPDMNAATAAEPPLDDTHHNHDDRNKNSDVRSAIGAGATTSVSGSDTLAIAGSGIRGVVKNRRGGRRKVSGFKRESPLAYRDFVHGHQLQHQPSPHAEHQQHHHHHYSTSSHHQGLGLAGVAAAAGFTAFDMDKKKRGAECLNEEDLDGNITELKVLITSRTQPDDSILKDTVPLHHAPDMVMDEPMAVDEPHSTPSTATMLMRENSLDSIQEDEEPEEGEAHMGTDDEELMDVEVKEVHIIEHVIDPPTTATASPTKAAAPRPLVLNLALNPRPISAAAAALKYPFTPRPITDAQAAYKERLDQLLPDIQQIFSKTAQLNETQFVEVTGFCGLPRYINRAFFYRCGGKASSTAAAAAEGDDGASADAIDIAQAAVTGEVNFEGFEKFWSSVCKGSNDVEDIVFAVLGGGKSELNEDDFRVVVEDVVQNHPGLEFLREMDVFQHRYVETVVARIFYDKTRNTNPRMSQFEFRKDGIVSLIHNLQTVDDINQSRDVFSYKHFYVMYCKFWELDSDHDLEITASELAQYENGCLSPLVIERIFTGAGRGVKRFETMSYREFVWFVLAVENKDAVHGIEYWFRTLDVDADGAWSLWELKMFYEEQCKRMREFRMADPWEWKDFSCSILDMVNPVTPHIITLSDLKRCKSAGLVFDMIFDIRKYDLHLRRIDPGFREWDDMYVQDRVTKERVLLEGWDKFAERAYEELACDDEMHDDSDGSEISSQPGGNGFYMDEGDMFYDDDEEDIDMTADAVVPSVVGESMVTDSASPSAEDMLVTTPHSHTDAASPHCHGFISSSPHPQVAPIDDEHPAAIPMDISMPPDSTPPTFLTDTATDHAA
ncbi:hypothetical protein PhCBS80983_g01805 [Powellomyces hirtus]|uniref:PP2A regulatory subunit B'' EF-hand domain-containing protein n=1 Tax=Powellomyces hirtus TaxID=109895 RepID=A0A507E907_9FUNG|nr:hypothetical protein PhCBS80983_g01805 [Powellomyces hirtus]